MFHCQILDNGNKQICQKVFYIWNVVILIDQFCCYLLEKYVFVGYKAILKTGSIIQPIHTYSAMSKVHMLKATIDLSAFLWRVNYWKVILFRLLLTIPYVIFCFEFMFYAKYVSVLFPWLSVCQGISTSVYHYWLNGITQEKLQ